MKDDYEISVDLRKITKEVTFRVQYKNMLLVKIGFWFIKMGCWISGAEYVDEFPMSLYQEDKTVK